MKNTEKTPKTIIIMPAYNVGGKIASVLDGIFENKEKLLVVDDGSTDNTLEVLNEYGINYISNQYNMGVSEAIKKGVSYAQKIGFNAAITIDSDGQHDPRYLNDFIKQLSMNDVVWGNRFSRIEGIPSSKIASNTFASCLINYVSGVYIPDVACGYKGFWLKKEILDTFKSSNDYSFVYDLILCAIKNNYKMGYIDMEALYQPSELWFTRKVEIESLLCSISNYKKDDLLDYVIYHIQSNSNYSIQIEGIDFHFYYLDKYAGYFIQASFKQIVEYHKGRVNE